MIVIRHTTGPLAGKEQRVEALFDRIVFGRDPETCDVIYPADETRVSRLHFRLTRRPPAGWTFDVAPGSHVAMNGRKVASGTPVHDGATIELGQPGGPAFVISEEPARGVLPTTQPQWNGGGRAANMRRIGVVAAFVVLVVAVVVLAILYFRAKGA